MSALSDSGMTGSLYGQKARSKFVMVIKRGVLMSVVVAMTISGCDFDPQAMNAKITALDARIAKLEVASALPSTPPAPSIPTVLWVQNPGSYPRASSYYSSKEECAQTAAMWGFTDDKSARQKINLGNQRSSSSAVYLRGSNRTSGIAEVLLNEMFKRWHRSCPVDSECIGTEDRRSAC